MTFKEWLYMWYIYADTNNDWLIPKWLENSNLDHDIQNSDISHRCTGITLQKLILTESI